MEPAVVTTLVCPACHSETAAYEDTCPECGKPLSTAPGSNTRSDSESSLQTLLDNRALLLLLLFGATAGLGIPLLWKSRAFSWHFKIVLTVVLSAYTVLILWLFWLVFSWSLGRILEAWTALTM